MRENDDYILNYAALLACIVSNVTSEKAIRYIAQQDLKRQKRIIKNCNTNGECKRVKTKVINIITNEELIFDSCIEASNNLGIFKTIVPNYMKTGKTYKGEYRFERVEC